MAARSRTIHSHSHVHETNRERPELRAFSCEQQQPLLLFEPLRAMPRPLGAEARRALERRRPLTRVSSCVYSPRRGVREGEVDQVMSSKRRDTCPVLSLLACNALPALLC